MRQNGDRVIKLKKKKLLAKILDNKKKHIKEYNQATHAYHKEALRQLNAEKDRLLNKASLDIKLDLITPIDNSKNYDKIYQMFEWEISANVELTQSEFNEYVLDDNSYTRQALLSNTRYLQ